MTQYVKVYRSVRTGNTYSTNEFDVWVGKLSADGKSVELLYENANSSTNDSPSAINTLLATLRATENP